MSVDLKVVVIVAFDELETLPSEREPWRQRYCLDTAITLKGCPTPILHDGDGLGLLTTGIGKTAAAVSTSTLLASDRFDLDDTVFISVGVAGGPPQIVDIGSVVISSMILDWDLKVRWDGQEGHIQIGLNEYLDEPSVFQLDEAFVTEAVQVASATDARVFRGTNVCGDELWHGASLARQVSWLVATNDCEPYLVTEMEDAGTARALDRFGILDRYLSIRGISNFDRPEDDTTARESFLEDDFEAGFSRGLSAAFEAASTIVDHLRS